MRCVHTSTHFFKRLFISKSNLPRILYVLRRRSEACRRKAIYLVADRFLCENKLRGKVRRNFHGSLYRNCFLVCLRPTSRVSQTPLFIDIFLDPHTHSPTPSLPSMYRRNSAIKSRHHAIRVSKIKRLEKVFPINWLLFGDFTQVLYAVSFRNYSNSPGELDIVYCR